MRVLIAAGQFAWYWLLIRAWNWTATALLPGHWPTGQIQTLTLPAALLLATVGMMWIEVRLYRQEKRHDDA